MVEDRLLLEKSKPVSCFFELNQSLGFLTVYFLEKYLDYLFEKHLDYLFKNICIFFKKNVRLLDPLNYHRSLPHAADVTSRRLKSSQNNRQNQLGVFFVRY